MKPSTDAVRRTVDILLLSDVLSVVHALNG